MSGVPTDLEALAGPFHWVCDGCGRKPKASMKVPKVRCHGFPLRPQGEPWCAASKSFYAYADSRRGWGTSLASNYWISAPVIARLKERLKVTEAEAAWSAPGARMEAQRQALKSGVTH